MAEFSHIVEIIVGFAIVKIVETITNLFVEFVAIIDSEMFVNISRVSSLITTTFNFVYHQLFVINFNLS